MSNLTAAARRRLIVTAARGFDVKTAASLAAADAFVALTADGMSSREIAAELVTAGALFAPAYGTVARYVKVRKAMPADVTADDFVTALRAETRARSMAGKGNARANGERTASATAEPTVTAPVDGGEYVTLTADNAMALLASIVTAAQGFRPEDRHVMASALRAASEAVYPFATTATIAA